MKIIIIVKKNDTLSRADRINLSLILLSMGLIA